MMKLQQILEKYRMPKALVPVEHRGILDVDLRYNFLTGELTEDRYYGLINPNTGKRMNIRVRGDELLEIYPIAAKEDCERFHITTWHKNSYPYLSINMKTGALDNFYYVPEDSDGQTIYRLDQCGKMDKTYHAFYKIGEDKYADELFKKYKPFQVGLYYEGLPFSSPPVAALIS